MLAKYFRFDIIESDDGSTSLASRTEAESGGEAGALGGCGDRAVFMRDLVKTVSLDEIDAGILASISR